MADVRAAREEVQKVVAFLTTRFGYREDVFKHLTAALAHLQDDPAPKSRPKRRPKPEPALEAQPIVPVVDEPEPETVTPTTEEPSQEPPSEEVAAPMPRRRKARRSSK